jgi:hypothetical protein
MEASQSIGLSSDHGTAMSGSVIIKMYIVTRERLCISVGYISTRELSQSELEP